MRLSLSLIVFFCLSMGSLLSGCSRPTDEFKAETGSSPRDRVGRMNATGRQKIAPNLLFQKVLEGDLAGVRETIENTPALLNSRNEVDESAALSLGLKDLASENTALGLALSLREKEIASYLIDQLQLDHISDQNAKGESYVFLAAKNGYHDLIVKLADRYYNSHGGLSRYHFEDLDLENNLGQRALHVAADRQTAETLQAQYYRSTLGAPYWKFTLNMDDLGQSFLHTAAADGRVDVLLWGTQQFCDPSSWEKDGGWYTRYPYTLGNRLTKTFQTYVGDFGAYVATLFNRQDENGNTALHTAVQKRNTLSVRALAQCRWLDYYLANNAGNIPLQESILQLPAQVESIAPAERETFDFLLGQTTKLRRWIKPHSAYLNNANNEGKNSLHQAAQLADPSIYETLAKIGDIYAQDLHGHTPQELFEQKQGRVKLYGH